MAPVKPKTVIPAQEHSKPNCFLSDYRFICRKPCPFRQECLKLVAEWLR
ncbi:MAG: hypothetical protein ACPW60_13920 [Methylohalobius sp. ZOD2]|nr:hypothetical protein [Methylothermaceae bacterium]